MPLARRARRGDIWRCPPWRFLTLRRQVPAWGIGGFLLDSDAEQFSSGGLPDRRQKGILTSSETGHWALLVSRMCISDDGSTTPGQFAGLQRADAIWGKAQKGYVSLFDGMRIGPGSRREADPQETWLGGWWAESPVAWIGPDDRADKIEIEFDVGTAWAESPWGHPPGWTFKTVGIPTLVPSQCRIL